MYGWTHAGRLYSSHHGTCLVPAGCRHRTGQGGVQTQHRRGADTAQERCRHRTGQGGVQTQHRRGADTICLYQNIRTSSSLSVSWSVHFFVVSVGSLYTSDRSLQSTDTTLTHVHHAWTHTCTRSPSKIPPIHSPKVVQSCRGAILALCCLRCRLICWIRQLGNVVRVGRWFGGRQWVKTTGGVYQHVEVVGGGRPQCKGPSLPTNLVVNNAPLLQKAMNPVSRWRETMWVTPGTHIYTHIQQTRR